MGTVTGAPTGMTVSKGSAVNNEIPITLTIAAGATLGGAGQLSGTLSVPVTAPVATTLQIHWSKVNTGATGAAGASAVTFTIYAPNGTVFVNGSGTLTIATQAYQGQHGHYQRRHLRLEEIPAAAAGAPFPARRAAACRWRAVR